MSSPMLCEHANEVPGSICACPEDCYCHSHTCSPPKKTRPSTYGRGTGRSKRDGEMGKLEAEFFEHVQMQPTTAWVRFEGITFRLAKGSSYTPDLVVMLTSGEIICYEVKGYWLANARTKVKVVAEMFPFHFVGVMKDRKTKEWVMEHFS